MDNRNYDSTLFKTKSGARNSLKKKVLILFGIAAFLIFAVGVALFLRHYNYDFSNVVEKPSGEETTEEESTREVPFYEGKPNYLLVCTADADSTVRFAILLTADMENKYVALTPLMTDEVIDAPGFKGTIAEQLAFGSERQLVYAIEAATGASIKKCARCRDSGFRNIMGSLGNVKINVTEDIDIREGDLVAIFNKGVQEMSGEGLLRYIRAYEGNPEKQCEILSEIFRQKMTRENLEKADDLFDKMINKVSGNISIFDLPDIKTGWESLLNGADTVSVKVNF